MDSSPRGFMRADSARTMRSRAWSTDELGAGLAHILSDGRLELPDDLAQLKDHQSGNITWCGICLECGKVWKMVGC